MAQYYNNLRRESGREYIYLGFLEFFGLSPQKCEGLSTTTNNGGLQQRKNVLGDQSTTIGRSNDDNDYNGDNYDDVNGYYDYNDVNNNDDKNNILIIMLVITIWWELWL